MAACRSFLLLFIVVGGKGGDLISKEFDPVEFFPVMLD